MANIKTEVTRKEDREIFGKMNISYTLIRTGTCVEQMFVFSENLVVFIFFLPPFWDFPFCLITDFIVAQSFFDLGRGLFHH